MCWMLDAGCGVGENCVYLANKYGIQSVTGFDSSEEAVQIATDTVNDGEEEKRKIALLDETMFHRRIVQRSS